MAIDRLHQVPIPDRNRYPITINRGDHNKVLYVLDAPFDRQKGFAVPQRTVIGYVCPDDQSKMYPTDKYKIIFSRDWERQTGKKVYTTEVTCDRVNILESKKPKPDYPTGGNSVRLDNITFPETEANTEEDVPW